MTILAGPDSAILAGELPDPGQLVEIRLFGMENGSP